MIGGVAVFEVAGEYGDEGRGKGADDDDLKNHVRQTEGGPKDIDNLFGGVKITNEKPCANDAKESGKESGSHDDSGST